MDPLVSIVVPRDANVCPLCYDSRRFVLDSPSKEAWPGGRNGEKFHLEDRHDQE